MRDLGWLLPVDETSVEQAESELAGQIGSIGLPEFDSIAAGRLARGGPGAACDPPGPESLARAARQQGQISPEVMERMRIDRIRAQAEAKSDGTGND
jgi:hypothetical protein